MGKGRQQNSTAERTESAVTHNEKILLKALGVTVVVKAAVIGSIIYTNHAKKQIRETLEGRLFSQERSQEKHGL